MTKPAPGPDQPPIPVRLVTFNTHHGVGEGRQVDELAAQDQPAGLQPADVEQLGDQPGDAVGVVVDLFEHLALLGVVDAIPAVQHQGRVALHRGQR